MLIEKCSLSHVIPLGVEETGKDGSGRFAGGNVLTELQVDCEASKHETLQCAGLWIKWIHAVFERLLVACCADTILGFLRGGGDSPNLP